jgi:hypothetical protein
MVYNKLKILEPNLNISLKNIQTQSTTLNMNQIDNPRRWIINTEATISFGFIITNKEK